MPAAFSRKEISFAEFSELARSNSTKKVNFRIWPKLKRYENGPWIGNFSVPFFDSVGHIFEKETGLKLFESKYYDGFWRSIQREDEFDIISEWCKNWEDIIFIKDLLSISIALNYNFNSDG